MAFLKAPSLALCCFIFMLKTKRVVTTQTKLSNILTSYMRNIIPYYTDVLFRTWVWRLFLERSVQFHRYWLPSLSSFSTLSNLQC